MTIAATPVPLSEAKARLSELTRRVRRQHERIALTRNGEAEAVARIGESLAAIERGEPGADLETIRQDVARRRASGK